MDVGRYRLGVCGGEVDDAAALSWSTYNGMRDKASMVGLHVRSR